MKFERENNTSYMVLEGEENVGSEYDINILGKGMVGSLLTMHIRRVDNRELCYYEVTTKQQLSKIFACLSMKWEDVQMICESVAAMVNELNRYMLNLNCIRLKPEFMYVDMHEKKVYFTYCPGDDDIVQDNIFSKSVKELFDYILERFDHSSPKDEVVKVYDIYQRIVQNNYDAEKLYELAQVTTQVTSQVTAQEVNNGYGMDEAHDSYVIKEEVTEEEEQGASKHVLDVVPKQHIYDQREDRDNVIAGALKLVKLVALAVVIMSALLILMPGIIPLDISMKMAVLLMIIGIVALVVAGKVPEYVMVKMKGTTYSQPYEICELKSVWNQESDNAILSRTEYEEPQISKLWDSGVGDDKRTERGMEQATVLLSDYMKNKNICLQSVKLTNYEYDHQVVIEDFPALIGSAGERCQVKIEDPLISRIHCCISKGEDSFCLEDWNSTNGTKVNGEELLPDEKHILKNGDEILLATRVYKVEIN